MSFTTVIQPDASTGNDTLIISGYTTTNYGSQIYLGVGKSAGTNYFYRSLIKFPLNAIPQAANILSASLEFYSYNDPTGSTFEVSFYRVLRNWVELQVRPAYYDFANGLLWSGNSCTGAGTDREVSPSFTGNVPESTGAWDIITAEGLRADIEYWVRNNHTNNYGWVIDDDTMVAGQLDSAIASSDHTTAAWRPKLTVTWEMISPMVASRWV